jgi:hypothetical protein
MTEEIKPTRNFDFTIAGNTSDGRLMILVDDHLYGQMAYIIKDADVNNHVECDIIKTKVESPPQERQERIISAILEEIITASRE